jgi:hypothetical protein
VITIFTIPKPFEGHFATIQRNALRSWKLLNPGAEIVLFGDDPGVGEAARDLGLRHIPEIAHNEYGTPLVNDLFEKIQQAAAFDTLCYLNADLILTNSVASICDQITFSKFLIVGRRWNLDVKEEIHFNEGGWENQLLDRVKQEGTIYTDAGIDYFIFPRGLFHHIPPFAIGRSIWDNWLLFKACAEGASLIDASSIFTVIHQNHGYSLALMDQSKTGFWKGPEAKRNLELAGDLDYGFTITDADWFLTKKGLVEKKWSMGFLPRSVERWLVLSENDVRFSWFIKPILTVRLMIRKLVRFFRCYIKKDC